MFPALRSSIGFRTGTILEILYRYSCAFESGDFDTLLSILREAENDAKLEQIILEIHQQGYQQEETMPQDTNPYQTNESSQNARRVLPENYGIARERKRQPAVFQILIAALIGVILISSVLYFFTIYRATGLGSDAKGKTPTVTHQGTVTPGMTETVTTTSGQAMVVSALRNGTLVARNANTGEILWQTPFTIAAGASLNARLNARVGLAVQNHVIYLAANKQVHAFRANDGKQLWSTTLGSADPMVVGGDNGPQLTVDQNVVFASGYVSGNLYALDASTGAIHWHYDAPIPALLAVNHGVAYVIANQDEYTNAVKALSGLDGHEIWSYPSTLPLNATVANAVLYVQAGAANQNNPVGGGKEKKPLFALNATTGQRLWSVVAIADSPSPLAVSQGVVVLFSGNAFCGYHSSNGSFAWCTNVPSMRIAGDAVFAQQDCVYGIYASSFSTLSLNAFNPKTGKRLWSVAISGSLINTTQISSAETSYSAMETLSSKLLIL